MNHPVSRRGFLRGAAAASAFTILPAHAAPTSEESKPKTGTPPSRKVNLACIGIGNQGGNIARTLAQTGLANVVALCDVDTDPALIGPVRKLFPDVPFFQDFRRMFDGMADKIDAVSIGVPDHSHFPIAMMAMSLGKHVYIEKPLAHMFREIELMMAAAKKYGVVTQMGNQGHSGGNYFQFKSWTQAGVIRDVTRVDAFMNGRRRWHDWNLAGWPPAEPQPATIDWDVWTATAEQHAFSHRFHPGDWRGWYVYGNGALGDWGPHILDTVHEFLELGLPDEVEAVKREGANDFIFPLASTLKFRFPARGDKPPVEVTWYDGQDNKPPLAPGMAETDRRNAGKIIYTKDLVFAGGSHADIVRIVPESKMKEMAGRVPKITGKNSSHHANFLLACQGAEKTRSPFDVAGPLSQVLLLGVLAQRFGGKLVFDRATKRITNHATADAMLDGPPPRKGWESFYRL